MDRKTILTSIENLNVPLYIDTLENLGFQMYMYCTIQNFILKNHLKKWRGRY